MAEYGFEQKSFQAKPVRIIFISLLILNLFVWAILLSPDQAGLIGANYSQQLHVDFINVGQGDAILVHTPMGRNFLVDGGVNVTSAQAKQLNRELVHNYLRKKKISALDGIVVTHPHNDHLGGIIPVLKNFKVGRIWDCGSEFNTDTYLEYKALCERYRIPRIVAKAGDILDWGDELFVQVLAPDHISNSTDFSDMNNMSVVLLLRYGLVNLCLAGDIETEVQKDIVRYGPGIRSQIIKVPHHGSDTSIFKPFLERIAPNYAVIQVGRGNPFNHPSQSAIDLYESMGTRIYRNDHHGTVYLKIGGKDENDFSFDVDRSI